jgi:hypothetical protein
MVDDDFEDTLLGAPVPPRLPEDFSDADTIIPSGRRQAVPLRTGPVPDTVGQGVAQGAAQASQAKAPYRISVAGGEPISLDVPAYIGRRPSVPRIALGANPRLIRVHSDRREVSSTHVEIRQHGSSVVVTDLKSTNGTVVLIPGAKPLKLRQGESAVVIPGTVVDIGDGNRIEILSIQRLT